MNERIKQEWLKRLRSGEYQQGRVWLRKIAEDGAPRYCCLGVLCEIWWEETSPGMEKNIGSYCQTWNVGGDDGEFRAATLPQTIVRWSGLEDEFGRLPNKQPKGGSLADLNDNGVTFAEIADIIEAQL